MTSRRAPTRRGAAVHAGNTPMTVPPEAAADVASPQPPSAEAAAGALIARVVRGWIIRHGGGDAPAGDAPTRVLLSLLLLTPTEVVYTGRLADALLGFFRLPPALMPAAAAQQLVRARAGVRVRVRLGLGLARPG